MSSFFGSLGRLVELKCPSQQGVSSDEKVSFSTTVEGRRKGQVLRVGRRTWTLRTSDATTPLQVAAIMQFLQGAWGKGPFVFVPDDAPFTNLLSPDVASCSPDAGWRVSNSADGPMLTGDGWAARSIKNDLLSEVLWFGEEYTPVLPGRLVTASAYLVGAGAAVRVYWYDATGAQLSFSTSTVKATASTVVRSHLTVMPPAGAVSCRVRAVDAVQGAWPAVTWTDALQPYSDGQGCPKAVLHGASRELILTGPGRNYSNLSFMVTEVG